MEKACYSHMYMHGLDGNSEDSQYQELLRTPLVTCTCIGHLSSKTPISGGMTCLSLSPTFRNLVQGGGELEMPENSLFNDSFQAFNRHRGQKETPSGQDWKPVPEILTHGYCLAQGQNPEF